MYFSENVLSCTTEEMQGRAISVYKTIGSVGFLMGSVAAPLSLSFLNYDGTFGMFLVIYALLGLYSFTLLPNIGK